MSTIVRYHIQRGGLYLGDDRHATDDVPLWCEWGDPFVCGFSDLWGAEYWRRANDGSRIRVSINGELVTSRDEAIAQERAHCLEIVKQVCSAAVGSESTRVGVYLPEILAEEIEKQIRGEK